MQGFAVDWIIYEKTDSMRTKYFLIYVFVGIAFLAVSAWVFLSGGQNAKAIRAKYRLGSILIMATAMLSVASCSIIEGIIDDGGMVMCYDPVEPEPTENIVKFSFVKDEGKEYKYNYELYPGDKISVNIAVPTFKKYLLILNATVDGERKEIQRTIMEVEDTSATSVKFDIPVSEDITYKGEAQVVVSGYDPDAANGIAWINGAGNGVTLINII